MDFKKAFKQAQDFHVHVINNGSPEDKEKHMAPHHKASNYSLIERYNSKKRNKGE